MSGLSSKFVTEEEVQEKRQQRQDEWEKVRQPDDPVECPEEETRSLFDQLQSNKALLEQQAAEEDKLKTSVKGLEDEEVQFLNFVSNRQMQIERQRENEEKSVIAEMRSKNVITVEDKQKVTSTSASSSSSSSVPQSSGRKSQQQLLSGAIKRKSTDAKPETDEKKTKPNNEERPDAKLVAGLPPSNGVTQIAGILPGIGSYDDDSSTENSSNSSDSEADHQVIPSNAVSMVMQELKKKWKQQQQQCG